MGISQARFHKRKASGARFNMWRNKRCFEKGRPPANTKIGGYRVRPVRCRGGNQKQRALRLDYGNFAWASEGCTRKAKIQDVVYNATSNEMVRTKMLVKNCIVKVDASAFKCWYYQKYSRNSFAALDFNELANVNQDMHGRSSKPSKKRAYLDAQKKREIKTEADQKAYESWRERNLPKEQRDKLDAQYAKSGVPRARTYQLRKEAAMKLKKAVESMKAKRLGELRKFVDAHKEAKEQAERKVKDRIATMQNMYFRHLSKLRQEIKDGVKKPEDEDTEEPTNALANKPKVPRLSVYRHRAMKLRSRKLFHLMRYAEMTQRAEKVNSLLNKLRKLKDSTKESDKDKKLVAIRAELKKIRKNPVCFQDEKRNARLIRSRANKRFQKKKDDDRPKVEESERAREQREKKELDVKLVIPKIDPNVRDMMSHGFLYACITSRPGQVGRADGYILEGKELEFYRKRMDKKKQK